MSNFLPDSSFRDTLSSLKESFVSYDKNENNQKYSSYNQGQNMKSSFYQHISNTVGDSQGE